MYAGNDGYRDEPSAYYSWDSTVPRHADVNVGDHLVVRDKHVLLGLSVIDRIETHEGTKVRFRCPRCETATIKARKTRRPRFRCYSCGAEFDERSERVEPVTVYRAHYGSNWVDLAGLLTAEDLRDLCESRVSQHSIRGLMWDEFELTLREARARPG